MGSLHHASTVPLAVTARDEYGIYNVNPGKDGGVGMALTRSRDTLTIMEEAVIETRMKELDEAVQMASTTADELLIISVDGMIKSNPDSDVTLSENATCLITTSKYSVSTTSLDDYHLDVRIRELQKWGRKQSYSVFIGESAVEFLSRNLFEVGISHENKLSPTAVPFRPNSITSTVAQTRPSTNIPPNPHSITAGGLKVRLPDNYVPTALALVSRGIVSEDEFRLENNSEAGRSRYRGSMNSRSMRTQVKMMPDHLNCALFVTNIATRVTASEIFNQITCGRVVCLHIYEPDYKHTSKAAKIVFAEPTSARMFYDQLRSLAFRHLNNQISNIEVVYNRHGQPRYENIIKTRVLVIEGPSANMTLNFWKEYFGFFSKFELEHFIVMETHDPTLRRFEFRFVRIDGQAETCMGAIRNNDSFNGVFRAWYGHDPCDQQAYKLHTHI